MVDGIFFIILLQLCSKVQKHLCNLSVIFASFHLFVHFILFNFLFHIGYSLGKEGLGIRLMILSPYD